MRKIPDKPVGNWWAAVYCKGETTCGHSGFPSDSDGESVAETTADTTDDGANAASPEKRLEEAGFRMNLS